MAIGGHLAGGGYGYFFRKYGLVIDHVDFIELVHVNENKTVEVVLLSKNSTRERDKNSFWALRGGGSQNFGIMTKFGFKNLPQSPPLVYKYYASWILNDEMTRETFIDFLDKLTK